jgi:ribonucleotide reductase beta subunit family protein with ferritin-like domain
MTQREEFLEGLSDQLTLREAASLIARIHAKTSMVNKGKRFGMYPIDDWAALERTKRLEASFWTANEVDFTDDRNDFNELSEDEQKPLLLAFGFFAVGDGSIASMLAFQLILTAPTFEKQSFYVVQLDNERVHGETYSEMIYTLVSDPVQRDQLFRAVENVQSIKNMNEFIENAFMRAQTEKETYISLAAAEYLLFTPLFCIIFWYRAYKKEKLQQIIFSNEQIAKDEAAHCENGCVNYRSLPPSEQYTDKEIHAFVDHVCGLVDAFAEELCANITLAELTAENIQQYVRYVADDLLTRLGHPTYYDVRNPFLWMDFTNQVPKSNFYEKTVGEYSRFNVGEAIDKIKRLCNERPDVIARQENVYANAAEIKF